MELWLYRLYLSPREKPTFRKATLTVSPRNDTWETSAEIRYWWRITTLICVVLLIGWKFLSTNQGQQIFWNFYTRFSDFISRRNRWWHRETAAVFSGLLYLIIGVIVNSDARERHKGKAGTRLEYKTTENVCPVIEPWIHTLKKENSCCLWRPLSPSHCLDAWIMRWETAREII